MGLRGVPDALRATGRSSRDDVVLGHMCPDCGPHGQIFCPYCYGSGTVTDEALDRWQVAENAKMNQGLILNDR